MCSTLLFHDNAAASPTVTRTLSLALVLVLVGLARVSLAGHHCRSPSYAVAGRMVRCVLAGKQCAHTVGLLLLLLLVVVVACQYR